MRRVILPLILFALAVIVAAGTLRSRQVPPTPLEQLKQRLARRHVPSVDHSKLAALQQPFTSGRDVTAACLSCHTERGHEVMASSHWNWTRRSTYRAAASTRSASGTSSTTSASASRATSRGATRCHAGYGLVGLELRLHGPAEHRLSELPRHHRTRTSKTRGGLPASSVNLRDVAQHVGRPLRTNCGACHFFGGGGNNVKHGDLEQALFEPDRNLDVHMATDGANLQCVDCHTAENHQLLRQVLHAVVDEPEPCVV